MVRKLCLVSWCNKEGWEPFVQPDYDIGDFLETKAGFVWVEMAAVRAYSCYFFVNDPFKTSDTQILHIEESLSKATGRTLIIAGASSTCKYRWIESLALSNTFESQRIKPFNVELSWLGPCPIVVVSEKQKEDWWQVWCTRSCFTQLQFGHMPKKNCFIVRETLFFHSLISAKKICLGKQNKMTYDLTIIVWLIATFVITVLSTDCQKIVKSIDRCHFRGCWKFILALHNCRLYEPSYFK